MVGQHLCWLCRELVRSRQECEARICGWFVAGVGYGSWILSDLSSDEPGAGLGLCVHTVWLLSDPATVLEDEGTEYIERQAAILQYHYCMLVQNSHDLGIEKEPQTSAEASNHCHRWYSLSKSEVTVQCKTLDLRPEAEAFQQT